MASIRENLEAVRERVERARVRAGSRREVTLVAVTKTHPAGRIRQAYQAGQRHFGENRVQEFEQKHPHLDLPGAAWHLIGHLQSNKARRAAQLFDVIETVDTAKLARRLDESAREAGRRVPVFLEVRLSDEPAKSGCTETELPELARQVAELGGLELRGLMTMPPWFDIPEDARPYFRRLRQWAKRLGLDELSMGMSHDFEVAIEEGATVVRIGTAIFGARA